MQASWWLLALGVASGCGFSAPQNTTGDDDPNPEAGMPVLDGSMGGDADPQHDAPPGIDAPLGIDASTDRDGDGVPNDVDNCPDAKNANQHDHDGDHVGDVCDPCPHIGGSTPLADADGDHVGDACDPDPGAQNPLVLFEGFYDDSAWAAGVEHAGWTVDPATGTAHGSFLSFSPGQQGLGVIRWPTIVHKAAVTTSIRPNAFGTTITTGNGTLYPGFGLAAGVVVVASGSGDPQVTQLYTCLLLAKSPTTPTNAIQATGAWSGGSSPSGVTAWAHPISTQFYELDERFDTAHRCDVIHGAEQATTTTTLGPVAGTVAVSVQLADASVDYVFIVERP